MTEPEKASDRREAARLSLRALATCARDRPKTAGATAMARGRHLALDAWYRRRAKAREQAALVAQQAVLDRLDWQLSKLCACLDRAARAQAAMAAELVKF